MDAVQSDHKEESEIFKKLKLENTHKEIAMAEEQLSVIRNSLYLSQIQTNALVDELAVVTNKLANLKEKVRNK